MKNSVIMLSVSSALSGLATAVVPSVAPASFPLQDIEEGSASFGRIKADFAATLMSEGILAVNNIPFYPELREAVFSSATKCMQSKTNEENAHVVYFEDGTQRTTLASSFDFATGSVPFHAGGSVECKQFETVSTKFRKIVDSVSLAFATRLSAIVGTKETLIEPLLKSAGGVYYATVLDVVQHGQHLDHFHSYRGPATAAEEKPTIGFHTDQGLFIAISPPLMVNSKGDAAPASSEGSFLIKKSTGESVQLSFDPQSLVFIIGDGVEQYVNNKEGATRIRSVPHALVMPASEPGVYRNWFGRMFLPPNDALNEDSGLNYGEVKELLADTHNRDDVIKSIGCSASSHLMHRSLNGEECDEATSIYCWHRCMPFTATANPDTCATKGKGFNCTSDFNDHIYQASIGHGQFNPRCTDSTTLFQFSDFASDIPAVSKDSCASFTVDAIATEGDYTHRLDLNEGASLLWKVVGKEVAIEVVRTGARLGYIGFGISNPDSAGPVMLGGVAVLGIAKYDDKNADGQSLSVAEYLISNSSTAFSAWNTPLSKTIHHEGLTLLGCGGSMKFQGSGVGGKSFNLNGVNNLMYAMDTAHGDGVMKTFQGVDWLMYHTERKKFDLDFTDDQFIIDSDDKSGVDIRAPSLLAMIVSATVAVLALF